MVFSHAVYEEMADVSICLDQMVKMVEKMEKEDDYLNMIDIKLERLKDRLLKSMAKKYPMELPK
jgi:hypothetical protein